MSSRPYKRRANAPSSSASTDKVVFALSSLHNKYKKLAALDHLSTRCYNEIEMTDVGLHPGIQTLCGNIGALPLLRLNEPTYEHLTSEFLASYKYNIEDGDRSSATLTFQLGNEARRLSLAQFKTIFGFPAEIEEDLVTSQELLTFWYDTTGYHTSFVGASSSSIVHPVFRVIQRLLGNTIEARKEPSKVKDIEHRILFCMVYKRRIDLGHRLAIKLGNVKKSVCIGAWVTALAKYFNVNLELYSGVPQRFIDVDHLCNIGMLKTSGQVSVKIEQTGQYISLQGVRMKTDDKGCWYRQWTGLKLKWQSNDEENEEEDEEGEEMEEEIEEENEGEGEDEEEENNDEDDGPSLRQQVADLSNQFGTFATAQREQRQRVDNLSDQFGSFATEQRARWVREDNRNMVWDPVLQFFRNHGGFDFPPAPPAPQ